VTALEPTTPAKFDGCRILVAALRLPGFLADGTLGYDRGRE